MASEVIDIAASYDLEGQQKSHSTAHHRWPEGVRPAVGVYGYEWDAAPRRRSFLPIEKARPTFTPNR